MYDERLGQALPREWSTETFLPYGRIVGHEPIFMGLFFTLIFTLCAYLGPETLFGSLAQYHVEVIIAVLAILGSLLAIGEYSVFRPVQAWAVIGLSVAVMLSFIFIGLRGETFTALLGILPNVMIYFMVAINCKKKSHLQLLILVLTFTAFFNIFEGYQAARLGDEDGKRIIMMQGANGVFARIQARSFLADPNDFGQMLIGLLPCLFFFWKKGSPPRNLLFVYLPAAVLLFGLYLTHSRGAMMAVLIVAIFAGRKKLGLVPSAIGAGLLFVGLTASGWSGGREVSAASGSDRTDAWGAGLELLKAHPLFGVGLGRFSEYYTITAHNTLVVCAAELGLFGFFFWMLFLFTTLRDCFVLSKPALAQQSAEEAAPERPMYLPAELGLSPAGAAQYGMGQAYLQFHGGAVEAASLPGSTVMNGLPGYVGDFEDKLLAPAEIHRLGGVMLVSIAGFLAAGWFLSRAFTMTFFLIGGIIQALYRMGLAQEIVPPPLTMPYAAKRSVVLCMVGILMMYVFLRLVNLMGK